MSEWSCLRCAARLSLETPGAFGPVACPACGARLEGAAFPALWREAPRGRAGQRQTAPDGATCFYHEGHVAEAVCEGCGRFLCALCEVEFVGRRLCPGCIEAGFRGASFRGLDNRRFLYGTLALMLAVLPVLFFWATLVTAPAALFVVFRFWRAPGSLVRSERPRLAVAGVLAGLQVLGWGAVAVLLIGGW